MNSRRKPLAFGFASAVVGAALCLTPASASALATGHSGSGRPALAQVGSLLYVAWTGTSGGSGSKQINLGYTQDGGKDMAKVVTTPVTPQNAGPALLGDGIGVDMAWADGNNADTLTIGYYPGSGNALTCVTAFPGDTTVHSPALTADQSGNEYLAWTNASGAIEIGDLDTSACATGGSATLTNVVTLDDSAASGPALVYDTTDAGLGVVVAWTQPGTEGTIGVGSFNGTSTLTNQTTVSSPVGSAYEVGLSTSISDLYMTYTGTDGSIYLAYSEGCIPSCFNASSTGATGASGVGMDSSPDTTTYYAYFDQTGQLNIDSF